MHEPAMLGGAGEPCLCEDGIRSPLCPLCNAGVRMTPGVPCSSRCLTPNLCHDDRACRDPRSRAP